MEIDMTRTFLAAATLAVMLAGVSIGPAPATAQDNYPSRPVRILVTLPAGSGPDIRARIVADQLTKVWGRQVVVENRPGGGGAIGTQAVLSAPADGYTLLVAAASTFTILPVQGSKPPFDVNRDLIPIGLMSNEGMAFAVSPKLGVNTLADVIARAKAEPYKIVIGTNPAGSLPHLAARLFVSLSKAPVTVVPSTGGTNEAVREIMGGRGHAVIESLPGLRPALASGDVKPIAIMTSERLSSAPNLPLATETVPGLIAVGWVALVAPKGTPQAIVEQLSKDLRTAQEAPEIRTRLEQTGTPFRPVYTADLARFIESEQKLWWPVVKEAESK
jgi:tripartite-type tricarboxylate transporter receptor subunit TctC